MRSKKTIVLLAVVFAVVLGGTYLGINLTKNFGKSDSEIQTTDAKESVSSSLKDIRVSTGSPTKSSVDLSETSEADELPDVDTNPVTVEATTDFSAEIFATGEKAGTGNDGWINEMANQFNASHPVVDGKVASVTIRKVSSGLGYDYIRTGRYVPDGYTPSNSLYVKMLEADGIGISTVSDSLVTNTAGMLISNEKYDELSAKYGTVNLKAVVDAVAAGDLTMGYTNPYTSGTGLNFLVSTLLAYDSTNPLSDTATAGFQAFQANIPYVATTTQQMSSSASKGSFDGFVTEYQTYANNASQQATYKFVPFGYLHDNPLVTTTGTSQDKKDILAAFAEYCASSESQALATQYGFNADLGYTCENPDVDGSVLTAAQALWKQDKDSGRPIIAVFVADVSGSMDGEPLNALKQSLVNGMQYINSTNYVGLVSYSTNVTIELPIAQFDINQEAYFKGAVECLSAGGNTSTYDGIIVATDMLLKASEEHPDAKLMMFVLSDGNENSSRTSFTTIKTDISALQIPIYTIGYNANIDALQQLSDINEAASINASTDDVVYQLKNLFNSNL